MATLESEVAPILRAASRQERAAPVRAARASASPALDGGSHEISEYALMYGARETDAARGEAPAFSRGTSGLSRGLRLAAVTSSLALVALACVALGRGGVAARLGQADPASDAAIVPTAPRLSEEMIARDSEGRMFLRMNPAEASLGVPSEASLGMDHPLGDECESAVRDPTAWGDSPAFSETLLGLLPYADFTYIICTHCEDFVVPERLRGKVKMVHGLEVDECLDLDSQTHWVKASVSHGAAIAHAKKYGYASAAVLEEDVTSAPAPYAWQNGDFQELNAFLATEGPGEKKWHAIRLGYRPVDHESNSMVRCAKECECEAVGTALCFLSAPQCQLHSSDGYILRDTMYDYMLSMVSAGGVIDYGVLQGVPGQIVLTPQITYQTGYADQADHTDIQTQLDTTRKFYDSCMKPAADAAARANAVGASALGGLEEQERAWKAMTSPEAVAKLHGSWENGNTQPLRSAAELGSEKRAEALAEGERAGEEARAADEETRREEGQREAEEREAREEEE